MKYGVHQKARSQLIDIPFFKLIKQIPLDYMHLVLLGIVKRLLTALIKGPALCRLSSSNKNEISTKMGFLTSTQDPIYASQPYEHDAGLRSENSVR